MLSKFGILRINLYLCSENKNDIVMKQKILNFSCLVAIISFILMIASLIALLFPSDVTVKALIMVFGYIVALIFGLSLSLTIILGLPKEKKIRWIWEDDDIVG